jgi:hypothetical protein
MNRAAMILFPLFRLAHSEVAERIRDSIGQRHGTHFGLVE